MIKQGMMLIGGLLLFVINPLVEKIGAMSPGNTVLQEVTVHADTIDFGSVSAEGAKRLIVVEDHYMRNWTPFDIAARPENPEGKREDLVSLAIGEVREWTPREAQQIERIRKSLNDTIHKYGYRIPFPKEVASVRATMKDEGGAGGYTRSNWITLTDVTPQRGNEQSHTRLLAHETFHTLTRSSPEFREKIYETIEFNILPKETELPKDIRECRISNPDVSCWDSYVTFTIDGKPQSCTMVIYVNRPYTVGKFHQYINIGLTPLDKVLKPVRENSKIVIYPLQKATDFFDKVGRNTGYVIGPEEVMADNFAIATLNNPNVKAPRLQKKVQGLLRK